MSSFVVLFTCVFWSCVLGYHGSDFTRRPSEGGCTRATMDWHSLESAGESTPSSMPYSVLNLVKNLCLINGKDMPDRASAKLPQDFIQQPQREITEEDNMANKPKGYNTTLETLKLLLEAQCQQDRVNPYEYVYHRLGCKIQLLDKNNQEDAEELKMILKYVENTGKGVRVHGVYRVQRKFEDSRLASSNVQNRHLLWHGTSSANLLSILHQGLRIAPLGAETRMDHLFGKGIYLADMFAKSQHYTRTADVNGRKVKHMLLCEAALGKVYSAKTKQAEQTTMEKGYNSLKTSDSRYMPDPELTITWKGITVALGKETENALEAGEKWGLDYNDYVIFNSSQVAMRYLIEFED